MKYAELYENLDDKPRHFSCKVKTPKSSFEEHKDLNWLQNIFLNYQSFVTNNSLNTIKIDALTIGEAYRMVLGVDSNWECLTLEYESGLTYV